MVHLFISINLQARWSGRDSTVDGLQISPSVNSSRSFLSSKLRDHNIYYHHKYMSHIIYNYEKYEGHHMYHHHDYEGDSIYNHENMRLTIYIVIIVLRVTTCLVSHSCHHQFLQTFSLSSSNYMLVNIFYILSWFLVVFVIFFCEYKIIFHLVNTVTFLAYYSVFVIFYWKI